MEKQNKCLNNDLTDANHRMEDLNAALSDAGRLLDNNHLKSFEGKFSIVVIRWMFSTIYIILSILTTYVGDFHQTKLSKGQNSMGTTFKILTPLHWLRVIPIDQVLI